MGKKLIQFLRGEEALSLASTSSASDDDAASSWSLPSSSPSQYTTSPPRSPPWAAKHLPDLLGADARTGLIASLGRADGGGKIYSLAASGNVLYAGTDSGTVRMWRDCRDLGGFRTGSSGLVKSVVVAADGRVFTGHQDGKVRVWRRFCRDDKPGHRRVGSLPALGDYLASSVNPTSYVAAPPRGKRRRRRAVFNRHSDAVSCLSLDDAAGLLYSASWDRTFKAWRLSDSRCLDSVPAHHDAVNAVAAAGFGGLVLTGSADGTVKVWRRQRDGESKARHALDRVLRTGEGAVTAIAVSRDARAAYVGSSDGLVACWRWASTDGQGPFLGGVLAGHGTSGVMCLAVSGPLVVSGSADGTLCAWRRDGAEHIKLAVLAGHTAPVKCVAVDHDDGSFVVYSGSLDGSVKVWRLRSDDRTRPDDESSSPSSTAGTGTEQSSSPTSPLPPLRQRPWAPDLNKHVTAA